MSKIKKLSVRELKVTDIPHLEKYWFDSEGDFLKSMGVDLNKMPNREEFTQMLLNQLATPVEQKKSFCMIWQYGGKPVGHSNTNPTIYGEDAYMHLHLWDGSLRNSGLGLELVKMTLPHFFEKLKLKKLYSEPFAFNDAPNKTLQKAGFDFVKEYVTTPGFINFEQKVKRWEMSREKFLETFK